MDCNTISHSTDDLFAAEKERLSSFRMGSGRPASVGPRPSHGRTHSRSHSRNASASLSSFSFPPNPSMNTLKTDGPTLSSPTSPVSPVSPVSPTDSVPPTPSRLSAPAPKRSSHHRRQSSVSTRRESAEVMGVSVPELPTSSSDDNINLGDRDSIRRRALLALEGKSELGSFSSMELPTLDTPEVEKPAFSFGSKPIPKSSFPPLGNVALSSGMLINKRDSFGKALLSSTSLGEQLGTLVEEEEEEEEEEDSANDNTFSTESSRFSTGSETSLSNEVSDKPHPFRLSIPLTPLTDSTDCPLPTPPSNNPSPRTFALKPLTLASPSFQSPTMSASPFQSPASADVQKFSASALRRLSLTSSPSPLSPENGRRTPLGLISESPVQYAPAPRPKRPVSIAYVSGDGALPTPEMTPTIGQQRVSRGSSTSSDSSGWQPGRPLSVTEQHFLFKSHNALLVRIEDLERALTTGGVRASSRPASALSDNTSASSSAPSDEMMQLVSDLKAERDELKSDVDGWRSRVADYERQVGTLVRRVESERRDAWVARERAGLVEEKKTAVETLLASERLERQALETHITAVRTQKAALDAQLHTLQAELDAKRDVEDELETIRAQLQAERQKSAKLEHELEAANLMATPIARVPEPLIIKPRSRAFNFQSMDSQATDVDTLESMGFDFLKLRAVVEEDEDNEHATRDMGRYEHQPDSSAIDLELDEEDLALAHVAASSTPGSASTSRPASPLSFAPNHAPNHSLSRTWTFPRGVNAPAPTSFPPKEVDRFFTCLDDFDESPTRDALAMTEERGKSMFCQLANDDADDLPPFVLPANVGYEVEEDRRFDDASEEDESDGTLHGQTIDELDDFGGEEIEGGIRFVFSSPTTSTASTPTDNASVTASFSPFEDDEDEDITTFTFPQSRSASSPTVSPVSSPRHSVVPPAPSSPELSFRPSSIPQPRSPSSVARSIGLPSLSRTTATFIPQPRKTLGSTTTSRPLADRPISPTTNQSTHSLAMSSPNLPTNTPSRRHHDSGPDSVASPDVNSLLTRLSPSAASPSILHTPSSPSLTSTRLMLGSFTKWMGPLSPRLGSPLPQNSLTRRPSVPVSRAAQLEKLRQRMAAEQYSPLTGPFVHHF